MDQATLFIAFAARKKPGSRFARRRECCDVDEKTDHETKWNPLSSPSTR